MKSGYELQRGHSWLVGVSLGVFIQYAACLQGGSEGPPQIPVTHPECTLCYPGDIAKHAGCSESGTGNVACTDEVYRKTVCHCKEEPGPAPCEDGFQWVCSVKPGPKWCHRPHQPVFDEGKFYQCLQGKDRNCLPNACKEWLDDVNNVSAKQLCISQASNNPPNWPAGECYHSCNSRACVLISSNPDDWWWEVGPDGECTAKCVPIPDGGK